MPLQISLPPARMTMSDTSAQLTDVRQDPDRRLWRWSIAALLILWSVAAVLPAVAADAPQQNAPEKKSQGFLQDRLNHLKSYPHLDMAYRRLNQGRLEEATKEFQQYLDLRPDDAKARYDYMNLLFRKEKYAEALTQIEGLPDADSNYALQQLKASIYTKQRRTEDAFTAYRKALGLAGNDTEKLTVLQSLAFMSQENDSLDQASQYIAQARAIAPRNTLLLQKQAIIAGMMGNKAEAARLARELTSIDPSPQNRAILANSPPDVEEACATYGQALGTAFQIIDDVLDYDGDAAEMGKNLGDDLREGKSTLPLIAAMERGTSSQAEVVRNAIEQGSTEQLAEIVSIVRQTGALDVTRAAAFAEARRAMAAARRLPANSYSEGLLELASQLLERRN